jgi:hypothetical protein
MHCLLQWCVVGVALVLCSAFGTILHAYYCVRIGAMLFHAGVET